MFLYFRPCFWGPVLLSSVYVLFTSRRTFESQNIKMISLKSLTQETWMQELDGISNIYQSSMINHVTDVKVPGHEMYIIFPCRAGMRRRKLDFYLCWNIAVLLLLGVFLYYF